MSEKPKVGVYVCHCGINIASTIDVESVANYAKTLPNVLVARNYTYVCSDPGQELIKKDIQNEGINRVVVAACSPRMHELTFRGTLKSAGLNPYLLEVANIREQCSWVHKDKEYATEKAKSLIKSAVAKAILLEPLEEKEVDVIQKALVVGGGIAGIQSALDIADAGFKVYLLEKEPTIGGHMAQLDKTFPTLDCSACILTPKMVDASKHPNIELITYSELLEVSGYFGNFKAKIRKKPRYVDMKACTGCGVCTTVCRQKNRFPNEFDMGLSKRSAIYLPFPQAIPAKYLIDPTQCLFLTKGKCGKAPACQESCQAKAINFEDKEEIIEIEIGTIIVATGYDQFNAKLKEEYGYGKYNNVISGLEFERLSSASGPTLGKIEIDGKIPQKIAFIHCVGSRDKSVGNEYCSRVCCMYIAKQAHLAKDKIPSAEIVVFYMDVRAFGKGFEEFYDRVRKEGIRYIRGNPSEIYKKGDKLIIRAEDTLSSEIIEEEADLVVLGTGLVPRKETETIKKILKLSNSPDKFLLEAHPKLRPVDTATDGIYLAGCCQGPKDIPDTVAQAKGAASSAMIPLAKGKVKTEAQVSVINENTCRGCGFCIEACPYGAIDFKEINKFGHIVKVATVNEALCKGCGACAAACLSGSPQQKSFKDNQILSMIEVLAKR